MISPGKFCYGLPRSQDEFLRAINIDPGDLNSEYNRTIEYNKIQKDYILVCGCSQSFGLGVTKNQTYSSVLMDLIDLPVYNISIPGTGCDFISFNTLKWIINFPIRPKIIIIQWSHADTRMYTRNRDYLVPLGPWIEEDTFPPISTTSNKMLYRKNILSLKQRSEMKIENLRSILAKCKIEFFEFCLEDGMDVQGIDRHHTLDQSPDNAHIGPLTHQHLAFELAKKFITKDKNVRNYL